MQSIICHCTVLYFLLNFFPVNTHKLSVSLSLCSPLTQCFSHWFRLFCSRKQNQKMKTEGAIDSGNTENSYDTFKILLKDLCKVLVIIVIITKFKVMNTITGRVTALVEEVENSVKWQVISWKSPLLHETPSNWPWAFNMKPGCSIILFYSQIDFFPLWKALAGQQHKYPKRMKSCKFTFAFQENTFVFQGN